MHELCIKRIVFAYRQYPFVQYFTFDSNYNFKRVFMTELGFCIYQEKLLNKLHREKRYDNCYLRHI